MSLRKSTISGVKWSSISQFGRQGLSFIVTAILARLLYPSDYGLIGMATVVIGFMELFKDLGTSAAIIQKHNPSEALISSIFWANVGFGCCITGIIVLVSPLASIFYHEPRLTPILQVLSVSFFLSSLSIMHNTMLQKRLLFNVLARIEIFATLIGGGVGIGLAFMGAGAWSLVFQSIAVAMMTTIYLWLVSKWRPRLLFSWKEVKSVCSYSLNLTGFTVFNYFARNADYILIARYLGAQNLGYYTLAYRLMLYPLQNVTSVIGRVLFPVFSQIQDDNTRFRRVYLKICSSISLITFPMMIGLWIVSESFILTVIGEKWRPVILLLMILAPVGMVQSIIAPIGSIYQAKGNTGKMFLMGVIGGLLAIIAFIVGLKWGVIGIAVAYSLMTYLYMYPNLAVPFRLIDLKFREFLYVLSRPFLCSLLMLVVLLSLKFMLPEKWPPSWELSFLVPLGIVLYGAVTWLFNKTQMIEVLDALRGRS